jgi:hypothetical protein
MRKPPTFGKPPKRPSAPKAPKLPKPEDQPAPRRYDFERALCEAIRSKRQVTLRYDDDIQARTFDPHVVYTPKDKVLVEGHEVRDPNHPLEPPGWHRFEIGQIRDLRVTDTHFTISPGFKPADVRYRKGLLCII